MVYLLLATFLFAAFSRRPLFGYAFAIAIVLTLAIHASGKLPVSDWAWYIRHFTYIYENGIVSYFSFADYTYDMLGPMLGVKPRLTEPVTYLIAYFAQSILRVPTSSLGVVFVSIFYFNIIIATAIYLNGRKLPAGALVFVFAVCLLVAPNYVLVNHLVRQELALSFLVISASLILTGRLRLAATLIAIAVLTHNSSIIFGSILIAGYAAFKLKVPPVLMLAGAFVYAVAVRIILLNSGMIDTAKNDGAVGVETMLLDAGILIIYLILTFVPRRTHIRNVISDDRYVLYVTVLLAGSILACFDVPLLALRFYFYTDLVIVIIAWRMGLFLIGRARFGIYVSALASIFGFIYTMLSIYRSPLPYDQDFLRILFGF